MSYEALQYIQSFLTNKNNIHVAVFLTFNQFLLIYCKHLTMEDPLSILCLLLAIYLLLII